MSQPSAEITRAKARMAMVETHLLLCNASWLKEDVIHGSPAYLHGLRDKELKTWRPPAEDYASYAQSWMYGDANPAATAKIKAANHAERLAKRK